MYFCILIRLQEYLVMQILMLCILMSLGGTNHITEVMNAKRSHHLMTSLVFMISLIFYDVVST